MTDMKGTETEAADEEGWLGALVGLPYIGDWVALGLLILPAVPLVLIFEAMDLWAFDDKQPTRTDWFVMLVVVAATLLWLRFVRRTTGVKLTFYWIPCVWLAWAATALFTAGVIFGF